MNFICRDSVSFKQVRSEVYNYDFSKVSGCFARWGRTLSEDPVVAPAPELLDLEISYGGDCLGKCPMCYKENGGHLDPTKNMTFAEFKTIFDKMPKMLTQIAFGIMNINTNPDFFDMMRYARANGVVPNYTCHGLDMTPEIAAETAKVCGAVAVSVYSKEHSYNAIKMLTDAGMRQVNIHFMLAQETYDRAFEVVTDIAADPRLKKLRAIVFLSHKPKGRNKQRFHALTDVEQWRKLIQYANSLGVSFGMDSCSAPMILKSYEGTEDYERVSQMIEPCEAYLFSSYVSADGEFFPCSFTEGQPGWETGIDVLGCDDFVKDVWKHPRAEEWRNRLLGSTQGCVGCSSQPLCRACPAFPITACVFPR